MRTHSYARRREHADRRQRVDALDLQLAHRAAGQAAVGTVGVGVDLMRLPIERLSLRRPRAFRRPGVFGEVEVYVNRSHGADDAGGDPVAGVAHGGHEVAVPHQEPDAISLGGRHKRIAFGERRAERFVLNDVQTHFDRSDRKPTVPLDLRADDGDAGAVVGNRPLDVLHVGNGELVGQLLVSLMDPRRLIDVVGHDNELEAAMRRHCPRHVVVLHRALIGAAIERLGRGRHWLMAMTL